MYSKGNKKTNSAIVTLMLLGQWAIGAEVGVEVELAIGHTDNISRVPDTEDNPAIEDTIYLASLDLTLEHASARTDVDLRGSLTWLDYEEGLFESETLPALDATAVFRVTDEVLSWFAYGNVGQASVDPFSPVTPENRQDVSYLTTGPSLSIPVGARNSLRLDAWISDIRYESQPLDNTRLGAQLGLARQINPSRALSLNFRGETTEFDQEILFPEIDRLDAFIQFDTEGARNRVSIALGASRTERQDFEADEPLATIEWERQVSPKTSFTLAGGTRVSDSADSFRNTQGGSPDIGDVQNQQNVTAPFREDYASLGVSYELNRTNIALNGRLSTEEYDTTQFAGLDRDAQAVSIDLQRRLGNSWTAAAFGQLEKYEYDSISREDEERSAGISLVWTQPRTVEIEIRIERFDRDSTDEDSEFRESRAFLGFRYIPDI